MRICMFSRIMPAHSAGGMQDHVLTLSTGLAQRGHQVVVITSGRTDNVELETIAGVEIHYLKDTTPGRYSSHYWTSAPRRFERLHVDEPFDILHSQSIGALSVYKNQLHRRYRLPLIASLHGTHFDVLTTSWHTDLALTNPIGVARFGAVTAQMLFNYATRDLWFIRGVDALIATSDADVWKYQKYYRVARARIRQVYNGIDVDLFAPRDDGHTALRAQLGIRADQKIILALARLQKDKGVQNAIAVMPRVLEQYPACLVIVGDGDYRAALEMLARNLGVAEQVRFVGSQSLAECARYFNLCDVFVDPTLRTDGYDLTIAEAMACAKPVIVSDVGANSTLIDAATQSDGILIPRGDNNALAREIVRVFQDLATAQTMGKCARGKIVARFSIPAMVDGMAQVYQEFAGQVR